jgi:chromosome segregation ATPase
MIMAATRCIDDTHALVANCCWRELVAHGSLDGGFAMDEFHTLRERVSVMRTDYQQLLMEKDYLMEVGEMYHRALREQELEVEKLTDELERTRGLLRSTQTTLQESESSSEEILEEIRQRSTTSVLVENQVYTSVTLLEDVGGLA